VCVKSVHVILVFQFQDSEEGDHPNLDVGSPLGVPNQDKIVCPMCECFVCVVSCILLSVLFMCERLYLT